jgi:hypothetical protein
MREDLTDKSYICYSDNEIRLIIRITYTETGLVREKALGRWDQRAGLTYVPIYGVNPDVSEMTMGITLSLESLVKTYEGSDTNVTVYVLPAGSSWVVDPESLPAWATLSLYTSDQSEQLVVVTVDKNYGDARECDVLFTLVEQPT